VPAESPVVRWVAPADGVVAIEGRLEHDGDQGDGVRARVVSAREGTLGDWVARNDRVRTVIERFEVRAGETLDFVVDCRESDGYDGYRWRPRIRVLSGFDSAPRLYSARDDFHGPLPPLLSPWEQYAQVLLLTNEFAFVD
jgi:hypothetical protein